LAEVLTRAETAGVRAVISAASSVGDAAAAAALAAKWPRVYCTAGVHPHDAKDAADDSLAGLEPLVRHPRCVAVGEIGLDYHYDYSPRDAQRRVFADQLALAGRLGRPIVVHTREAFDDTLAVLAESGVDCRRVVFHSFTGPPAETGRALDLGATVGFSGIVTFNKAVELRASAALVPDEQLLIETDAPFLSPEPVRKMKVNEPANVVHVAACLAGVRKCRPERIAEITTANAVGLFGLASPGA
jgi:TatD DNase family protein